MKNLMLALLAGVFLLAGCDYKAPLAVVPAGDINPEFLGLWVDLGDEEQPIENPDSMTIHKYSGNEYMLIYRSVELETNFYFRAFPATVEGIDFIQLQLLGDDVESAEEGEDNYMVVTARVVDGKLRLRHLNSELVDKDQTTTEAMLEAFRAAKDNPGLFTDFGAFGRMKPADEAESGADSAAES